MALLGLLIEAGTSAAAKKSTRGILICGLELVFSAKTLVRRIRNIFVEIMMQLLDSRWTYLTSPLKYNMLMKWHCRRGCIFGFLFAAGTPIFRCRFRTRLEYVHIVTYVHTCTYINIELTIALIYGLILIAQFHCQYFRIKCQRKVLHNIIARRF